MNSSGYSAEVVKLVRNTLENAADRAKRALVAATKEAMEDYYAFPEGEYYVRSGAFGQAYSVYECKEMRDPRHMSIEVGIMFDKPVDYPVHGIPNEEIYSMNLSGAHGGNGFTDPSVVEHVKRAADLITAMK